METVNEQRNRIQARLIKTPSLRTCLNDADWWADSWVDARMLAEKETGIEFDKYPDVCPWAESEILGIDWLP